MVRWVCRLVQGACGILSKYLSKTRHHDREAGRAGVLPSWPDLYSGRDVRCEVSREKRSPAVWLSGIDLNRIRGFESVSDWRPLLRFSTLSGHWFAIFASPRAVKVAREGVFGRKVAWSGS